MIPGVHSIDVGGSRRSFLLAEPANGASAVILSLHGTRSSAEGQARLSRMAKLADSSGAVVVFPEAVRPVGSGFEWDHDGDLPYLLRLVTDLLNRYPTPISRVCVVGMSGGGRMACHFASVHPETVIMAGAVAGLRAPDAPVLSRPVPVLAFHGTADRINPYDGSGTPRWDESVPEAARRWAAANGASSEPTTVAVSPTLNRTTYGSEGQPGEVTLWTAKGAGHTWPGAQLGLFLRMLLGRTTNEIDATDRIWCFAQRHWPEP